MDADYDANVASLESRNCGLDGGMSKRDKKRKRKKQKLRKALEKEKPIFNPGGWMLNYSVLHCETFIF